MSYQVRKSVMTGLWKFLFSGELEEPVFRYRRMKVSRKEKEPTKGKVPQEEPEPEQLRFRIVMLLSRTLAIGLILCVIGIFGLLFTDRAVPQFLTLTISAIVGYFGGATTAYVGLQKLKRT